MANKQTREDRAQDREQANNILSSFRLNVGDVLQKMIEGPNDASNAPSGFVDPNAVRRERMLQVTGKADGPADVHMDWDSVISKVAGTVPAGKLINKKSDPNVISLASLANRSVEKFAPVIDELKSFKFASSEDKKEQQLLEVAAVVKQTLKKMAIRDVVKNTKAAYDNAAKFFQTESGIRVVFKVASYSLSVTADGNFCGDEIVCLEQEGTDLKPYIVRPKGDGFENLTSVFDVKVEVLQ